MADTRLIGVKKENRHLIDKTRASSQINETDISLLTWLIYYDDRTDNGYRPKRGLNSFTEHQTDHQS